MVAASAIFWKVSRKEPRAKIVFLQFVSVRNKMETFYIETKDTNISPTILANLVGVAIFSK